MKSTAVAVDASVIVKWFVDEGAPHHSPARAIWDAVGSAQVRPLVSELALLETGNVFALKLGWSAERVTRVVRVLLAVGRRVGAMQPEELDDASRLAAKHKLSFYDSFYWAMARALRVPLVTADEDLLAVGAGETPARFCERLGIAFG